MTIITCNCGKMALGSDRIVGQQEPQPIFYHHVVHSVAACQSFPIANYPKETQMDFSTFVRKPFVVQAVEITKENIAQVAEHVGDLKAKEDGTPYILVDKRLVPNVSRVYIGFFMTKMGENVRCYSRKIFHDQFVAETEDIAQWVAYLNGESRDG